MRARLLLLVAGTVAALLLAEGAARLWVGPPPAPRRVVHEGRSQEWCCGPRFEVNGVHRFRAGSRFSHCYSGVTGGDFDSEGCVHYRINGLGYRGAAVERDKPAGVYRIVVIGDSFSFGEGTPEEAIFPTRLQEGLVARGVAGKRLEVVNLGMPGNDLVETRRIYEAVGRRLSPDWVVLQWNTNDFPTPRVREDHLRLIGARYRELVAGAQALDWSRLLSFLYLRVQMSWLSRDILTTTPEEVEFGSHRFAEIVRMRDLAERDGAGFTVLSFPELIRLDDHPYAAILERLRETCRAEGIQLVELLPALAVHRDRDLWVHVTDHHPNRIAHGVAAQELLAALDPVLPGAAP